MSAQDVDLIEGVAQRVAELLAAPAPRPLVDATGAADLLGVPASWLLAEARSDRVPHKRLGRYVRFDPVELSAWASTTRHRGPRPRRTGSNPVPATPGAQQ